MDGEKKFKASFELNIIFYIFLLICVATLVDIIPGVNGSIWATRLYGIVCLVGVIFCARKGLFMAIDSFVMMYPESLQGTIAFINKILMLAGYVILEIALIFAFSEYINGDTSEIEHVWKSVLYVLSLIVYPVSLIYLIRDLFKSNSKNQEA